MKTTRLSRRLLLKSSLLAGGGLLLGMQLPGVARAAKRPAEFVPNAFVRIDPTGAITLIMPRAEIGQGIYTSLAMLIAEELEVDLDQVQVQPAPPDPAKYSNTILHAQSTGGSTSIRSDWASLRQAGAAARMMLVAAAAKRWKVNPASCRVERGVVYHEGSKRTLGYGDVAAEAASQPVPQDIKLKDPSQFKLIGTAAKRLDAPSKVDGRAVFGIDVKVPGMRIGTVAISPAKDGKLVSLDEAAARRIPGVHEVIRAGDEAVAVIGDHMWAAKKGLEALRPVWNAGSNGALSTASLVAAIARASEQPGVIAKQVGDAARAIDAAVTKVSAIYQSPFLSHSAMEPLSCTLHIQPDRAEVWVSTQVPPRARQAVVDATGLPLDKVIVNNMLAGGSFGRRLEVDSILLAANIAKQVSYPLKLVWTREQDLRHDYYRPYYYDRVSAGLDARGRLVGRTHRVTGPSIFARFVPARFKGGLDPDAIECAAETPYDIPADFIDYVRHEHQGMNTGFWRGVGATHNLFVVESFVDELAIAAKQDPVAFRRNLLQKNPRALAVMNLAAEKSGWGSALAARTGRGISVQYAFGTYLSCVLEVEVPSSGEIVLRRAVVTVDCGIAVNPDTVRAQIEGGLILGLGTAMFNQITVTGGAVDQSNFHDYRALRINEAPKIEVFQIHNNESPGGIGEVGTAAAAPALGNAIFAATGKRLRRLPFGDGQLRPS